MGRLDGKVAIISGAARGTGAVMVRRFAAEGANLVLGDVKGEAGRAVAEAIGPQARFVDLDVRDEAAWARAVGAGSTSW